MSLLEIKDYLIQVKAASLANLCSYFNCDSELLRQMLAHWIRKGKVRQCKKTSHCGVKCMQCSPSATEIYEWV
jgi:putative ferrous iron transport protein C